MSPLSPLLELMSWHLMLALLVRHVPGGCQTKPGHTLSLPSLISQHIQTIFPNLPFPVLFFPSKSDLYWALVGLPTVPTSFPIFLHAGIWPHYACFPKRSTLEPPIWGPRWTQAPLVSSSIQSRSIFHQIRREEGFTNSGKEKKNMPAAFKWIFFLSPAAMVCQQWLGSTSDGSLSHARNCYIFTHKGSLPIKHVCNLSGSSSGK